VWDIENGALRQTIKTDVIFEYGWGSVIESEPLALMPDGFHAIFRSNDYSVALWELSTGTMLIEFRGHTSYINAAVITPDACHLITASADETLRIWDIRSGQTVAVLEGHARGANAVTTTQDGKFVISVATPCIKVWSIEFRQAICTLNGHTAVVNGLALTPDDQFLISVSQDRTLRIWHLETGKQVAMLEAHAPLLCCAVSPDGKTILAGDAAGGLHILDWHGGNLQPRS
jgi:WD40 repeat protein